jgi:exodeoxyribonuclease VII small subunit
MSKAPDPNTGPSFEDALQRLDDIVADMEGDRLALDELLARYEEGTRLVRICMERLSAAERRIETITREARGEASSATAQAETPEKPRARRQSQITAEDSSDEIRLF